MDIRLVKERALSNHEVTRSEAVIQSECGMNDGLWYIEDENAKDAFPRSDLPRQPWTLTMFRVVCLLCGLGNAEVCAAII